MGVRDVGSLSLGQWTAICRGWAKVHGGKTDIDPPSDDEFEAAVMAVRGG